MKSKVLKLAKRLGKFCAEDILPIISITEIELQKVLLELKSEGAIKQRNDRTYFYQDETKKENKKLPLFFEFRTKEELELIIYLFASAFKPLDELLEFPPKFFVKNPTFQNFIDLFQRS